MNKLNLLPILLVMAIVLVSGCTTGKPIYSGEPTYSGEPSPSGGEQKAAQATTIQTLDIWLTTPENWDADPDVDGIELTLNPKDASDSSVETDGIVRAKLWLAEYDADFNKVKGALIKEWENIQISEKNFGFMGVKIRLEYGDYTPESGDTGILEVTLTTPDNKQFTARDNHVMLTELF